MSKIREDELLRNGKRSNIAAEESEELIDSP
jgi:hypothetical protein